MYSEKVDSTVLITMHFTFYVLGLKPRHLQTIILVRDLPFLHMYEEKIYLNFLFCYRIS